MTSTSIRTPSRLPQETRVHRPYRATPREGWPVGRVDRPGLLAVLTGAAAPELDLLVGAARRRYAGSASVEFPARIATRPSDLDAELIAITGRVFRDIENGNGFAVAWQHAGARHGLTAGALQALEAGAMVVVAAPSTVLSQLLSLWPRTEVLWLTSAVERARPSPSQRTRPLLPDEPADATLKGGKVGGLAPIRIAYQASIADAARGLHAVLDHLVSQEATRL